MIRRYLPQLLVVGLVVFALGCLVAVVVGQETPDPRTYWATFGVSCQVSPEDESKMETAFRAFTAKVEAKGLKTFGLTWNPGSKNPRAAKAEAIRARHGSFPISAASVQVPSPMKLDDLLSLYGEFIRSMDIPCLKNARMGFEAQDSSFVK